MRNFWKYWALIVALMPTGVAVAQTPPASYGITSKNLGGGLRTRSLYFNTIADYTSAGSSTGCYAAAGKIGLSGCAALRTCGASATSCRATETSSSASSAPEVGAVYPPSRLWIGIDDLYAFSTPTCTKVELKGIDAAGNFISEVFSSIDETGQKSKYAYAIVKELNGTGCSNFSTYDELFAQQTTDVAFGGDPVQTLYEVDSICTVISNVRRCLSGRQLRFYEPSATFIDKRSSTIDLVDIDTETKSASPVDLDLETAGVETFLTWRLRNY